MRERDEPWFRAMYTEHYPAVARYAVRRLGSPSAAEELAQEVFLTAWRRRADIPGRELPWLYGVARRLLANEWRRTRPAFVELTDSAAPAGGVDELLDVRAALATLSEDDQELLRLVGWEQLSVSEAAAVLGCGRTVCAVRLHRARRRLTAAMERAVPATSTRRGALL
ncbi:siderophore-interacting protein [Longispora fulva]|uniref:RNA polymerase sigma-70 factor (ECF subfamily) n=1 Tax=Longispora fulva TaxID=619741 RepID=A0A8J7KHA3_9ACTN|nr:RNA polymerase sigma factor [Longispora fulva]MBG6138270.1 RNA polymerase sigma-70 factor (ECF subfamily) [Longispora fulva]GIG60522.1 siderophore-interacting protein [Longispora fulva]